jgi:hypothetical protein
MERPPVTFDEDGHLRVLDVDKYQKTQELETECREFAKSEAVPMRLTLAARQRARVQAFGGSRNW